MDSWESLGRPERPFRLQYCKRKPGLGPSSSRRSIGTLGGVRTVGLATRCGLAHPRLELISSGRTVTAQVVHFINGPVIQAKTSEWALQKQLYSIKDTCAYINLGKVFAQRCLESGITEVFCDIKRVEGGKVEKLLNEITNAGIKLQEPEVYKKPNPWDQFRPEKPWEITEE
ncbi:hypothetical protein K1T71_011430 [Dendrolimus kikuchii]|uniref:Uncharacterized protein n=1 Tax=Dendrolimus kikuchii TaxID=765133 RepID=A0ACC1CNQ5_9NEOP|nr:hypothetical protein K1T71_011430 [Dendrolimus kikuchii]